MSEPKFTPGPWGFSRELNVLEIAPPADGAPTVAYCFWKSDDQRFEASYFAENVANTKHADSEEAFANAALIAAAPELYACVEEIVRASESSRTVALGVMWLKAAREALAMARGDGK